MIIIEMSLATIIKNLYTRYKSDVKYNTALILSEIIAPWGAAVGAYLTHSLGASNYASSVGGGLVGNYISAAITFVSAWYFFNREQYQNRGGTFIRESGEILLKNLPPVALSYVLYSPLAAGFAYLGVSPSHAALYASIVSGLLFIVGSNVVNQRVIGRYRR